VIFNQLFLRIILGLAIAIAFQSCQEEVSQPKYVPDSIHQKQINELLEYGESIDLQKDPALFVAFFDSSIVFLKTTQGNYEFRKSLIYYLSEELESVGLVDESIEVFNQGLKDNTVPILEDSIYYNRAMYGRLAQLHKKSGNQDSAFYYEHLSYEEVKKHKNPYEIAAPLNELGYHHMVLGHLDSAMYYFNKSVKILEKHPPNTQYWDFFRCSVDDNMATIYEIEEAFQKTIPLYQKNYDWYWRSKHISRKHNAGISLGDAFIETAMFDSAFHVLDSVFNELQNNTYPKDFINKVYLNQTYSKLHLYLGDSNRSNQYAVIAAVMEKDMLSEEKNIEYIFNKKLKLYAKERNRQKIALEQEQNAELTKTNNLQLVILLFVVTTIGMTFWVFYSKSNANQRKLEMQTKIAEQQAKQEQNEKQLLDIELEYKKKDLIGVLLNLKQKEKWAQDLNEQMKMVKTTVGHSRRNELNKLHNQIRFHLQASKEAELYTNNFELLDAEFHTKLLNQHPNLTKSEQKLFSLIKIRLNSSQIAQIKNVELSSIKTLRHRLKQKLELKAPDNLDKFIHQF
jgi:hypothetical protein